MNHIPFRASVFRPQNTAVSNFSRTVESPVEINVLEMVQQVCRPFESEFKQQQVELSLDVDNELRGVFRPQLTQEVLSHLIEDSLNAMPDGGQLDVIAVMSPTGIEIEVSDSSFTFEGSINSQSHAAKWQRISAEFGLQIDTMLCPQGGLARTLILPWSNRSRVAA
ncbi:MAG: HAMP domain-containing histidine kinase [Planctomycetaceae bacterium]|nr:HAMP domain-containing histidine kinase [Planctomycetaceae bacterium]